MAASDLGIIGRTFEDGRPVIFKLVDALPAPAVCESLPWLTVVSWKYDGASNNGMPDAEINEAMVALETAIEAGVIREDQCRHAYSRTGNGLKELVYYVADRDAFMARLNAALRSHPRYPVDVHFYADPAWEDFRKLLGSFRNDP